MTSMILLAALAAAPKPEPTAETNAPAVEASAKFTPTGPLLNPFWPTSFKFKPEDLEPITNVPTVDLTPKVEEVVDNAAKTASDAAAALLAKTTKKEITQRDWAAATKTLKFTGKTSIKDVMTGERRTAYMINGKIYGINDFISVNHNDHRFTWRIGTRTDTDTLKLEQIRVVEVTDETDED